MSAQETLRELHRLHRQLADCSDRASRGPKQIKAHEANVARLQEAAQKATTEAKAARVQADAKELQLKTSEGKIADLKRKLNEANSNREYHALQEQIAADSMATSVLADEILEAMEKTDVLKAAVAEADDKLAKAKAELEKTRAAVAQQSQGLDTEIARLEGELRASEGQLPADIRDAYDRVIKGKGSDGMAPVDGENCGGCFQQLTLNTLADLKLGRVAFCKNCGRLLYVPEDRGPGLK